jgi:hypothetical protein
MAYRRRNRLRRRNARPSTKRAFKRTGRGIKGVTTVAYRRPGYGTGGLGAFGTRLGSMGRIRNAARAAQLMQRRVRRTGTGGGGEIGWVKKRGGKYRPMTVQRLMNLSMQRTTFRFQGVNRMNEVSAGVIGADGTSTVPCPGFFKLNNDPNSEALSEYPLMAFDLTTVNNKTTTGNGVAYSLYHDTTTNGYRWLAVNGQGPGGSASAHYSMEDNTSTMATTIGTRFIEHQWFDIRAVAYGTRTQPTYYDFMVVKFTRDYLQPCLYADETKLSVEEVGAMRSFWAGLVKNISYNAIMPGQRDVFKGMTVLRRFRFTLQSSAITDSDRNPNMRIVKLFQKHYQVGDYNWGKEDTRNAAAVGSVAL